MKGLRSAMAAITSLACGPQANNQGNTGQSLIINGADLAGATTARIGAKVVPATVNGAGTQVVCTVPVGCGIQNVIVTATSGTSNPLPFYYISTPAILDTTPAEISATDPGLVTISGVDLQTLNKVSFDGSPTAAEPTVVSNSSVTVSPNAMTPVGANPWVQSVDVTVRTSGGSSTRPDALTAYDTPTVAGLVPSIGLPGLAVVVNGTGFVGSGVQVTFGGLQAALQVLSGVSIRATAPVHGPGAVDVIVTTPGGSSAPVTFTYLL
jgi:IPT/TIG domain